MVVLSGFVKNGLSGRIILRYRLVLLVLVAVFLYGSCSREPGALFGNYERCRGLMEPVMLQGDTTVVPLSDLFLYRWAGQVDSVTGTDRLNYITDDSQRLNIMPRSNFIPYLSEIRIWVKGVPYSLLVKRGTRERIAFTFDPQGDTRYSRVFLSGDMNGWNPASTPLNMIDGVWQTRLELEHGTYRYVLIANGREVTDPSAPKVTDPESGREYSLLEVGTANQNLRPLLSLGEQRRDIIEVLVENGAGEVFVLWENHSLPPGYVSGIEEGSFRVRIPADAAKRHESTIRIWAYNENGLSEPLRIELEQGRIKEGSW